MKKIIELMSEFGAFFLPKNKFKFPLKMISHKLPIGINYKAGVSAQLKSAVIFAGLNSYGYKNYRKRKKQRSYRKYAASKYQTIKIKNSEKKIIRIYGRKIFKSY